MPWRMPLKKPWWRMCQMTNFGASNEETKSKIGIYAKKLSKIGRFGNFNFWSKVNTKVKVNKGQSQLVKTVKGQLLLNVPHGPGWFRVKSRIKLQSRWFHHDNVALTWTRADMARACVALANVNKWCHGWRQKNVDIVLWRMHDTWQR